MCLRAPVAGTAPAKPRTTRTASPVRWTAPRELGAAAMDFATTVRTARRAQQTAPAASTAVDIVATRYVEKKVMVRWRTVTIAQLTAGFALPLHHHHPHHTAGMGNVQPQTV